MNGANSKRWETLRRSLRVCHDGIDSGLIEIQNISNITSTSNDDDLLRQLLNIRKSIQENLQEASQITDEMATLSKGDPIQCAQVSRLEAVTSNYSQEFYQTTQTVEKKIERRKLLIRPSVIGSQQQHDLESGPAVVEQQQLLREKDAISSSLDMLSNVIAQGKESLSILTRQGDRFVGVSRTLQQFTNRFPQLRSLMSRIHRAKLKQTVVLSLVVSCCLLFMLWYSFK